MSAIGAAPALHTQSFIGSAYKPPDANYACVQLWNPVGSGVVAAVLAVRASVDTANAGFWLISYPAATNFDNAGHNKILGGAVAQSDLRIASIINPLSVGTRIYDVSSQAANVTIALDFSPAPIFVPEGGGLMVAGNAQNISAKAGFEWYES